MEVNPDWYRYFLAAAETGSFSKGAAALGITQSALSQGIRNLEKNLGTRLFDRSAKGTAVSSEGRVLLPYVLESVRLLDLGEQELKERKNLKKGHLVLGAGDTVCKYYLLSHIKAFHQQYPGIRISIINRTSGELTRLLENRTVDIAVVTTVHGEEPGSVHIGERKKLFEISDCFSWSPCLAEKQKNLSLSEILATNVLLLPSPATATRRNLEHYIRERQLPLVEVIDFESVELQTEFAVMGMGITYAPLESMKPQIQAGSLVPVHTAAEIPPRSAWALYQKDPAPRISAFLIGL